MKDFCMPCQNSKAASCENCGIRKQIEAMIEKEKKELKK